MAGSILGNAVRRVEDPGLLVGAGTYVGDLSPEGGLSLYFVRSPVAHAELKSVDVSAAASSPGVVAVLTGQSMGIEPYPVSMVNRSVLKSPLAQGKVRFVGEAVAAVLAETRAQAVDAAELVEVDYVPLAAVTDLEAAMGPGAPLLFEELGTNLAIGAREPSTEDVLEGAEVVVRARFENQRVAAAPIEGNAIVVVPGRSPGESQLTVYAGTQTPHGLRDAAARLLGLAPEEIRVVAPYVGGGFGGKTGLPAEYAVAIVAASRHGRAVKWQEDRGDNLVGMNGRSQVQYGEMGFKRTGEIVGLRARVIGDAGAYAGFAGFLALGPTRNMLQGVYRIPRLHVDAAGVLTNTSPVGAFRGAGRPEAAALLERLMDMAADELGIDPVEIRRMNYISRDQFPYQTLTGMLYDSGDYGKALDEALKVADYGSLRAMQAERRASGDRLQIGIGVSSYVEITAPGPGSEYGSVEVSEDGTATVRVGTMATGQGHATAFAMIVSDRLGIPLESITFIQADTAEVPRGGGTVGSRSLQLGGSALERASVTLLEKAKELASELLEADEADVVLSEEGRIGVAGVPARSLGWGELAAAAVERNDTLASSVDFRPPGPTFPFGTHVSVVEVDTETGYVRPLRHVAVDDAGTIVNPMLAQGQQHGGIAQGMSQALWETISFDDDGTPLTSSFASYCIPSAAETCSFEASNTQTPTPYNPLGAKGIGESATIGSTPAVQNAVIDALSHLGVRQIEMPCTPERVWDSIRKASAGQSSDPWREPPGFFSSLPPRGGGGGAADSH